MQHVFKEMKPQQAHMVVPQVWPEEVVVVVVVVVVQIWVQIQHLVVKL
jgi:hypothetical protein